MDRSDRPDPVLGFEECLSSRRVVGPPGLQPQQRGDRLKVVLHPVMDLADGRILREQEPVPAAEVGDVSHEHRAADDRDRRR